MDGVAVLVNPPRLIKKGVAASPVVTPEPSPRALTFASDDGGFSLTSTGVVVTGKPIFGDWESALNLAVYLEERSPFWKADLLEYGHTRADWLPIIDAVVDASKFTESTVRQYRHIAKAVPMADRVDGLSFSHHAEVAALPAEDKRPMLERAKREHLSVSALRQVVRKARKVRRILKGQASELAKAQERVIECAHEAAALCREIAAHDCQKAEALIGKARRKIDQCEEAVTKFRTVQGKKS